MKTISLLGSTGSIGTQTLDVIRRNKDIKVAALAAGTRVKELAAQAREFKPELGCIGSEKLAGDLKTELADMDVRIVSGSEGLIEAATISSADIVLTAVVGMMGIDSADGFRRTVPRKDNCGFKKCNGRRCAESPKLVYG